MALTDITIRVADPRDAAGIAAVDAEGLATGHASFRELPHDWASFSAGFLTGRGLALVAQDGDGVAAWAGISPTSARPVYEGVGEVSIYVSAARQGIGLGRLLLQELVIASERVGYWTLVAQIFPENTASLSLHAALDFKTIGVREKLGQMRYGPSEGQWRDVVMLERRSQVVG